MSTLKRTSALRPARRENNKAAEPSRSHVRQRPSEEAAADDDDKLDNQFISALARGLDVLNAFRPGDRALGNVELAERTKLPKPTISRIAYTLVECGYLTYDRRHRMYELGIQAFALGRVALAHLDVRRLARPLMQELATSQNFNVGIGTRDRTFMIYTDACEGEGLVGLRLFAGSRIPIVSSAMGRAYLAALSKTDRDTVLNELRAPYGAEWPTLAKRIDEAVQLVETRGFCVSLGDWQKDIHGAAAPIRLPDGERIFAINLGGPAYALPEEKIMNELGPRVSALAAKVQRLMWANAGVP